MTSPPQLVALARKPPAVQSLGPTLMCALPKQESFWNSWAMRYEPAFFAKCVAHLFTNNKITADKTKTSALTKERDAVVRAAEGGSAPR